MALEEGCWPRGKGPGKGPKRTMVTVSRFPSTQARLRFALREGGLTVGWHPRKDARAPQVLCYMPSSSLSSTSYKLC